MNDLTEKEIRDGWELLFDGKSLAGWGATGSMDSWKAEDGCICWRKPGGYYLYTLKRFTDFQLQIDFRIEKDGNTGIIIRWSDLRDRHTGMEVQILDSFGVTEIDNRICGALYDLVAPQRNACKPAGEWNTYIITCRGPHIDVTLNDLVITSMDVSQWTVAGKNPDGSPNKFRFAWGALPREGHIALQEYRCPIWFRNIKIKRL